MYRMHNVVQLVQVNICNERPFPTKAKQILPSVIFRNLWYPEERLNLVEVLRPF